MVTQGKISQRESAIWDALRSVHDPEIPVLSVVDLGMVAAVRVGEPVVEIDLTPTFVGCPAVDVIRAEIDRAVRKTGETNLAVKVVYDPPWTSDRITEQGRRKLLEFGLAPPGEKCSANSPDRTFDAQCPYCRSMNTTLESIFGPTLCRSIHYCRDCLQSFEQFKTI